MMTLDPGDIVSGNGDCCVAFSASDSEHWKRGYLVLAHFVFTFTREVKGQVSSSEGTQAREQEPLISVGGLACLHTPW